jgi:NhaA family Na+:H+ antiporter
VAAAPRTREATARLLRPFQAFFELEAAGGLVLLACAAVAIVWANSPLAAEYRALWSTPLTVGLGGLALSKPLLLWVNDGLMAVFFFVVGLEIKREVLTGELSTPRQAALPLVAALGGMVVPAAIYALVNAGRPSLRGWGIPMATDVAFALGVLALLGPRVPLGLRVFLTALAIADDLGAVMVIALFYSGEPVLGALAAAGALLGLAAAANRLGVHDPRVYALIGLGVWVATLESGVHATVAGVLMALAIPSRRRMDPPAFVARGRHLLARFGAEARPGGRLSEDQRDAVYSLELACREVQAPLGRLEHALHPWVAYGVMPVFALANAGVALPRADLGAPAADPVTIGVALGLVLGKPLGILGACALAVRWRLAELPAGTSWRQLGGVGLLGGIGFTMSLFIAALAFGEARALDAAKLGVLGASIVAGIAGYAVLAPRPRG